VCLCDCDECAEAQREELEQLERDRVRTRAVSEEARHYRETYADDRPPPARAPSSGPWMYLLGVGMLVAAGVWIFGQSGGKFRDERASTAVATDPSEIATQQAARAPAAQKRDPLDEMVDRVGAATSLSDAIARARPGMADSDGEPNAATWLRAGWIAEHDTRWAGIGALQVTSFGAAMKDWEAVAGRRLCMSGTIGEIVADRMRVPADRDHRFHAIVITRSTAS
jgi:hypothetical protein